MTVPRRAWLIIRFLLPASILLYIFSILPLSDVLATIAATRWALVVVALPLVLLGPLLSAARLKILTNALAMSLSVREITEVNFITRFYGLALPGQLATGAIRWLRLTRIEDRKTGVLAAILFSRLLHLLALGSLGAVFYALDLPAMGQAFSLIGLLLLLGALSLGMLLLALANRSPLAQSVEAMGSLRRVVSTVRRFRDLSRASLSLAMGFSLAENLAATVVMYLLAQAVGASVPFVSLGWIRATVQLLIQLPISISGLGVREGGLLIALEPYGVAGSSAVALSLLIFGVILLVGLIGGVLELRGILLAEEGGVRKSAADRRRRVH